MPRIGLFVALGLVAACIAAFAFGLRLAPLELRKLDKATAIDAAEQYNVEITRDEWGVPRIIGESDADAAFGFAFAHAEDDFSTIQEALRSSLGPDMLARGDGEIKMAYLIQALGILDTVARKYEQEIDADTRAYLEAYAAGLNYYAALHPEEAEADLFPVTGQDVTALAAFFSPLFYGMSRTLTKLVSDDVERDVARGQELQVLLRDALQHEIGSNAIAVGPSRSTDGATRVIINSHQPVTGPLSWYEAHLLSKDGLEFAGGAFPGGPFLHLGGNQTFGQAATVNSPDLIDVYELELTDGGYLLDGETKPFETSDVSILINLPGPFALRVKRQAEASVHGPVFRKGEKAYALRYATMDSLTALPTQYAMQRATSVDAFQSVLSKRGVGATNRVVGDVNGRIARYYNARMPKRPLGTGLDWEGYLPGNRKDLIWSEFESFDALPHMIDPEAGYVLDSNHSPFRVTLGADDPDQERYPIEFGIETAMTNRGLRAVELMSTDPDGKTSRDELLKVKYDDGYHPESLGLTLRTKLLSMDLSDPDLTDALRIIEAWNGRVDKDNREAALSIMTYQPIGVALF
ncbi:MAG: penicillin acylase family protein, partial [Pseudomonadota bacterium]